jgi:hypothetical protein
VVSKMPYKKILNIDVNFLRMAGKKNFMDELRHEIERKLSDLDDVKALPYDKPDIIQLIEVTETYKVKFIRGIISAKQLYHDVDKALDRFKTKHPGFDLLKDPATNAYYARTSLL